MKKNVATRFVGEGETQRGRVVSIKTNAVTVTIGEESILCAIKGVLKKEKAVEKTTIVVGDWVQVIRGNGGMGWITEIEPRKSFLCRKDPTSKRKRQLLAVNVDQVLITLSVLSPRFPPMLVDRYLIATKQGNMDPVIVINKMDLLDHPTPLFSSEEIEKEKALLSDFFQAFAPLQLPIFTISLFSPESLLPLREKMIGKTSVFSGPSGVGKSSLINATTQSSLLTRPVGKKGNRGRHTTSATTLVPLEHGGECIDTPGLQSFSLWNPMDRPIALYFPDFSPFAVHCHFPNCTHSHEPKCGVKEAVSEGKLHRMRYDSYLKILAEKFPKEWE